MSSSSIFRFLAASVAAGCIAIVALALVRGASGADDAIETVAAESSKATASDEPPTSAQTSVTGSESPTGSPPVSESDPVPVDLPILAESEPLQDLDGWLQTDAASIDEIGAPVTIVQFWTFGCYNCKNTLPHLQSIYADYHDKGLEIVGVHAPEFDHEKDPDAIQQAAIDLGVSWPIALDTRKTNLRSWQGSRRFWPRTYVLDAEGRIRFDHVGEGAYDELEAAVAELLSAAQAR